MSPYKTWVVIKMLKPDTGSWREAGGEIARNQVSDGVLLSDGQVYIASKQEPLSHVGYVKVLTCPRSKTSVGELTGC